MSITIQSNVSLQPHNTMAVQAKTHALVSVSSLSELGEALDYAKDRELNVLVLGEGSNTLFENDYNGLVILNQIKGIEVLEQDAGSVLVKVAAGENWHDFVQYSVNQGWFGLENLALIPGLVGAAPMQNIGAYGVEIKDTLVAVDYIDIAERKSLSLSNAECAFAYRESRFKNDLAGRVVVTSVTFRLSKLPKVNITYPALATLFDGPVNPKDVFDAVVSIRGEKLPLPSDIPNTGSFFKNPIVTETQYIDLLKQHSDLVAYTVDGGFKLAAGWMIEKAGWKQRKHHGVSVHAKQALVIVNPEKKTGKEVVDFAKQIQQDIISKFGVLLEIEPRIYG